MKHISLFAVALLLVTACATWRNVPDRLDDFVDKAEKTSSKYSPEDWKESKAKYEELINLYAEHEDQYTLEEKARVMKDIGRYHALLVVNGINEAAAYVETLKKILPSYLEGINEVIDENKGGVIDLIKGVLNPEGVDRAVRGFMDELEGLAEEVSEGVEEALEGYEDILKEIE